MGSYHRAVHRYLLGALRDEDAAEELFQEFALRFVRGDFRWADRGRGRFRDEAAEVEAEQEPEGVHRNRGSGAGGIEVSVADGAL
jgi:hypothetical protein